jgi:hypothetical protein
MDRTLLRERSIYGAAFLALAVNRVLMRMPALVVPQSVLEQDGSWYYSISPWFSAFALLFAVYRTYRFFRYRGKAQWVSILNAIAAPWFWPLIMLPQMLYIVPTWKRQKRR